MREARRSHRVTVAGILIGVGMGGFMDGIVLHQMAQWHHMRSNVVTLHTMDAMRVNMTWDGLFHVLTWVITLVGILHLRNAAYARDPIPSAQAFTGQLILGWGVFNLVEGVIDHQLLGIHNVRELPNATVYNFTFLAVGGMLFTLIGWLLMRAGSRAGAEAQVKHFSISSIVTKSNAEPTSFTSVGNKADLIRWREHLAARTI
jgi:uncharacterized membrane protein